MGILPGLQIERDVSYAASQGFKRFAALLPNSPYGHAVADALGPATARYQRDAGADRILRSQLPSSFPAWCRSWLPMGRSTPC